MVWGRREGGCWLPREEADGGVHASPGQSPKQWYEEINPHLSQSDELAPSAPSYPVPGPAEHPPQPLYQIPATPPPPISSKWGTL